MKKQQGYFERSQTCFMEAVNAEDKASMYEGHIERCRIEEGSYSKILSGPPPDGWGEQLPEPQLQPGPEMLLRSFERFRKLVPANHRLYYSSLKNLRRTDNDLSSTPILRESEVWSLIGVFHGPRSGVRVVFGSSGPSSGLEQLSENNAERISRLVSAVDSADRVEPASGAVVLSPAASAVLMHETLGHTLEATVTGQKPTQPLIGCRIANSMITITDDPIAQGGMVRYEYDDDNIRSIGKTTIVDKGLVTGVLHSSQSADMHGCLPTANGRASSAWESPIPRMSNICCQPGKLSEGELLEQAWNGIYIHRLINGICNGRFIEAEILLAECVRRGRRTGKYLTGGFIREPLTLFTRLTSLGDNPAFYSNALCGKAGQLLFNVGTMTPSAFFQDMEIR